MIASLVTGNKVLTNLVLLNNNIGDEGAAALASALRVNAVLTKLVLWDKNLGEEGKGVIRDAVSGRVGFELKIDHCPSRAHGHPSRSSFC